MENGNGRQDIFFKTCHSCTGLNTKWAKLHGADAVKACETRDVHAGVQQQILRFIGKSPKMHVRR